MPVTPVLLWKSGAVLTASGILTGAFGAHALSRRLGDKVNSWNTASHYAIFNGIALLAISQHPKFGRHKYAGPLILVGSTLFSGSIFALLLDSQGKLGRFRKVLGPTTPLGGLAMIAGYLSLLL